MYKSIRFFLTLLLLLAIFPAFASNKVTYGDEWTIHTAFDNKVRKIIDASDRTFFFVHQRIYNRAANGYSVGDLNYYNAPTGGLFYYDKNQPAKEIQDYAKLARLSGFDMRLVNYCPSTKTLVIAYEDGGIDVVDSNHQVRYLDYVKKRLMPGGALISAINFDDKGDIWISTGAGFVHFDATSLNALQAPQWSDAVSDIAPVGDNVICAIGTALYGAPASSNLSMRNSYTRLNLSNASIGTILNIMPLGKAFAIINTAGQIFTFTPTATGWTTSGATATGNSTMSQYHVVNASDHTVTPTAKGFYVATASAAYSLEKPAQAGAAPVVERISLPSGSTIYNASYDLNSFWFFMNPRNFENKTRNASAWTNNLSLSPNSPLNCYDAFIVNSESEGVILTNRHPQVMTNYTDNFQNVTIASYKNGKWRNLAPAYNPAQVTTTNTSAQSTMQSRINGNRWITGAPQGVIVDPVNPNVLWIGSMREGIAGVYLDDPTKNPHIINSSYYTDLSDFNPNQALIPSQGWLPQLTSAVSLGADKDNTLWFFYNATLIPDHKTNMVLYGITREAREEAIKAGALNKKVEVKEVIIPSNFKDYFWQLGTVLTKNPNKFVTNVKAGDVNGLCVHIYDNNGTPFDPSDDTITPIYHFRVDGAEFTANDIHQIVENPVTGEVIVCAQFQTYVFNPNDPIVNGAIDAHFVNFTGEGGLSSEACPNLVSNFISFDEYGRMWIPTHDYGLVGLSPDTKEVIARYDATNSPLGYADVHSVGWNKQSKTLMVSANNVVAEVKVDKPGSVLGITNALSPIVSPSAVGKDFAGTVAIHNLPANSVLKVRDSKGTTVCQLEADNDGVAFWNLLDEKGNRVPSDSYSIVDASTQNAFDPISLPVIR